MHWNLNVPVANLTQSPFFKPWPLIVVWNTPVAGSYVAPVGVFRESTVFLGYATVWTPVPGLQLNDTAPVLSFTFSDECLRPLATALTNVWTDVFVEGTVSKTCTSNVSLVTFHMFNQRPLTASVERGYDLVDTLPSNVQVNDTELSSNKIWSFS